MKGNKLKIVVLFICSFFLLFAFWLDFQNRNLLKKYGDEILLLDQFYLDGIKDNLEYRLIPPKKSGIFTFTQKIPGENFKGISGDNYHLLIHRLSGQWYRVYFNDNLLGVVGDLEHGRSNIWNYTHLFSIDADLITEQNVLKIEVMGLYEMGKSDFPIIITKGQTALKLATYFRFLFENIYYVVFGALWFAFAMIITLYFISGKIQQEFLYFSLAAMAMSINFLDYFVIPFIPFSVLTFKKITLFFMYLACYFIAQAVYKLYKEKITLYLGTAALVGIILLILLTDNNYSFKVGYNYLNLLIIINILNWLWYSWKNYKFWEESQILLFSTTTLLITGGIDIVNGLLKRFSSVSYTAFGVILLSFAMIILVVIQYLKLQTHMAIEEEKTKILYEKAITDSMTGVYNHQYIISVAQNLEETYGVIMLDCDNFKDINDTFGHQLGDEVIKSLAKCCQNNVEPEDYVGRYGGDEFAIILVNKKEEEFDNKVFKIAEKIKGDFESLEILPSNHKVNLGVSIGFHVREGLENYKEVFRKADLALYHSKSQGKGRITGSKEIIKM
ncbi:diguanylate cyclase (GGDEF) domain-containing protein [Anaerobranca californiensis DSM 14826]|jgi:diguanylate cyclase (GGDEF)-like protein|uniref:Diguanylate cyclase (GGDEF) domain-containing protein n=1 Tax=Anaerobranca californiensis DSM 14826 TaxID=1120989 RepID=A0A1M6LIU2_9FIRM|nr:GGDEF domain-containing protein [Anaerobranca californiensis]SHJ71123.1 diguanylate cyclase (GGDEF) domain-containing protein [Anaerobranca californiensis DSM 14826]